MNDWWKLSLMENWSARLLKTGTSPACMLENAMEFPPPLSSTSLATGKLKGSGSLVYVVMTKGYKSFKQPDGFCRVALLILQSDCCHISKSRCVVSPV